MIVSDRFVFVHLHKAGGSWITDFLLKFFPESWRVGYHYPRSMIPPTHRHLPILGTMRNPWDFYVSYFSFQKGLLARANERNGLMSEGELKAFVAKGNDPLNGIDLLFQILTDDGKAGTRDSIQTLASLENGAGLDGSAARFDKLLEMLPVGLNRRGYDTPIQGDGFRGMNVQRKDLETVRGRGEGLLSFLFRHMYADADHPEAEGVDFIRMETLRDELPDYLRRLGIQVTRDMVDFIQKSERVNASKHEHYSKYYDPELVEVVRKHDGRLADRFGYTFESK